MASRKEKVEDIRTCEMCLESHDYHEMGADKRPFLCKCKYHRWSRFLRSTSDVCIHFNPKPEYIPMLREKKLYAPDYTNRKR